MSLCPTDDSKESWFRTCLFRWYGSLVSSSGQFHVTKLAQTKFQEVIITMRASLRHVKGHSLYYWWAMSRSDQYCQFDATKIAPSLSVSWLLFNCQWSRKLVSATLSSSSGRHLCSWGENQTVFFFYYLFLISNNLISKQLYYFIIGPGTGLLHSHECLSHATTFFGTPARTFERILWRGSNIRVEVIGGRRTTLSGA